MNKLNCVYHFIFFRSEEDFEEEIGWKRIIEM